MAVKEKYEKEVKRWKKWTTIMFIAMPIVIALGVIDVLYFKNTGKSVMHPYLAILLTICACGLFVVAAAARLRWYWIKTDLNKSPKN